jgi:hypothetical protein
MEELVKLVSQKTGLSEDVARKAVEIVLGYLKEKLPDPIAAQIDGVLSGTGTVDLEGLAKGLGGILGKK